MPAAKERRLLTLKEASEIYNIPVVSLRLWCQTRKIETIRLSKFWYVTKDTMEKFIEKSTTPAMELVNRRGRR